MPSLVIDGPLSAGAPSPNSSFDSSSPKTHEKTLSGVFAFTDGPSNSPGPQESKLDKPRTPKSKNLYSLPNGMSNGVSKDFGGQTAIRAEDTGSTKNGLAPNQETDGYFVARPGPSQKI